jgi:Cu+-exporting ATPase
MSPAKLHGLELTTTTCFICNLHCPSCVESIRVSLCALDPRPEDILVSIVSHSVVVRHATFLTIEDISTSLEAAGFEIHSIFQDKKAGCDPVEIRKTEQSKEWLTSLERAVLEWYSPAQHQNQSIDIRNKELHMEQCQQCRSEGGRISLDASNDEVLHYKPGFIITTSRTPSFDGSPSLDQKSPVSKSFVASEPTNLSALSKATLAITGMTCSSCVSAITHAVEQLPGVQSMNVNLLTHTGTVIFHGKHLCDEIVSTVEDCGFDVLVEMLEDIPVPTLQNVATSKQDSDRWRATYAITRTASSRCSEFVSDTLKQHLWIEKVDVNLITNTASVLFTGKHHLLVIKESIENAGYDAMLDQVVHEHVTLKEATERSVAVHIRGMFCHHCPSSIRQGLKDTLGDQVEIVGGKPPFSLQSPILYLKYSPKPPRLTIRHIFNTIATLNPVFEPSVFHPPTIEDRAREVHAHERKCILFRLMLCIIVAVPTFIIGIVFMSLIDSKHPIRQYLMGTMWAGNATRLSWSLFILATPVYLFAADTFHRRAIKEIRAMWRPGSRTPWLHRFTRFGSMNMLISLGTSIAYFASVVELALAATKKSSGSMHDSYFDAVVFLTMFLLIGRFLEAYSKAKTGDAVTSLGALRPDEAVLIDHNKGDSKIDTDLLEVGDVVRVQHGTSPPFDGVVIDGSSVFDESSLTGESRPVNKAADDLVFSGTLNKGAPVKVRITTISGTSMLDQIIDAVREGQTRRAPVERVADTITSHFVPFVIAVAIITWLTWLILGTTGGIPKDWKNESAGGWALWSLRFAIAVFVIACPCGIGLAAPTALFVGGGLAAKHGILVRGGGEAFQEASSLDCIVFDKTGTLTQGGDPAVTDYKFRASRNSTLVFGIVKALEQNSSHPIARALISFCDKQSQDIPTTIDIDEVPGKGLKGTFRVHGEEITAIVGNESFVADHQVPIDAEHAAALQSWKSQGKSVALLALLLPPPTQIAAFESLPATNFATSPASEWQLSCIFSISDSLRSEAIDVIDALKKRGIDVWMLSGDNSITANAVGAQVGISSSNIIAGVLPDQKAEKIKYLQQILTKPRRTGLFHVPLLSRLRSTKVKRATVAMVGDGINDAPALSTADLSIAIGSGSDIALSSSSFVLINSRLTTILTLLDLSRIVFRRVYFNFGWALVYNMIALPIAAGVLFPISTGTEHMDMHHNGVGMKGGMAMENSGKKHIRLDPVWASLAMALSSVSVVCSSLALRSQIPGIGFKVDKQSNQAEVEVREKRAEEAV